MLQCRVWPICRLTLVFVGVANGTLAQTYSLPGSYGYAPPGQQGPADLRSLLQSQLNPQGAGQQQGGGYQPSQQPYQQQQYAQQPYGQNAYPPQYNSQPQAGQQSAAGAQAEAAFRRNLMLHSMQFGGIFGPALKKWVETPSKPGSGN
jgi:hypothetical protein